MLNLRRRTLVVFIISLLSITIAISCVIVGKPQAKNQPCPSNLAVAETQETSPVRISILGTTCTDNFANVNFKVDPVANVPIRRYEVHMSQNFRGKTESESRLISSVSDTEGSGSLFAPHVQATDSIGVTLDRGFFRAPVDELKLYVQSVTFADGTVWTRT